MDDAAAWLAQGERLLMERNLIDAWAAFVRAEELGACADTCSGNRWTTAMLRGDLCGAWQESDALRQRNAPDPHRFWNGEDLRGKRVIVRSLHGFGDAVQMLRYAPMLARIASSVVYEVAPRMVELACMFDGVIEVITWGDAAPAEPPVWEVQVEVMELPYLFRTCAVELPLATKYLEVPKALVQQVACRMGESQGRRIGLAWAGSEWDRDRAIPMELLNPVLDVRGFELWSLQGGDAAAEAKGTAMLDATARCGDGLVALAAVIANLDLVITVDTVTAHLAGAMGKPVWVLLQYAADWRWMTSREDSPWYSTMRLFRQRCQGDWGSVVTAVVEELRTYAR